MLVTLQELIDRAAAIADMHDEFVTERQWTAFANTENLALALFLARAGWTLNAATQTITVTGSEAGAFTLTAPLAIVAVHQVREGRVRLLEHENAVDFLRQLPSSSSSSGDPTKYRVTWSDSADTVTLNFYPNPPAGTQLLVTYIAEPARLSDSVGVRYPMGWEERIVLGMARRALVKEESDTSEVKRMMAELDQQIEEACWNRVLSSSPAVRNVDHLRGWTTEMFYPATSQWWWP